MTLLWVIAFSLSHHLLGETRNQKEMRGIGAPSTRHLSRQPASPRLCQEGPCTLPCPGQTPTPPALSLARRNLPPARPQPPTSWCSWEQCCHGSSSTRGLHRARLARRKGLVMVAGTTPLCFSFLSRTRERSCPVVGRVPSQSHHIVDSFPSHVPWTAILSVGVGHVTPLLSSCRPPVSSYHARGFWLSLCVPGTGPGDPPHWEITSV